MYPMDSESTLAEQLPIAPEEPSSSMSLGPESTCKGKKIDYRVSRVAILCKDCGYDVGFYPARHVCQVVSPTTESSSYTNTSVVSSEHSRLPQQMQMQMQPSKTPANSWTQWLSTLTAGTYQALSHTHKSLESRRPLDRSNSSPCTHEHSESSPKWVGVWNKLKASVQVKSKHQAPDNSLSEPPNTTTSSNPSSLRKYYVTKDGPVPDILKPRAAVRPDDAMLQKFEQQHHVSQERIKARQITQHG